MRTGERNIAQSGAVYYNQADTAKQIKNIEIEYQHLFPVLLRYNHGVQNQGVGGRSCDADQYNNGLEIVRNTTT